jgi:PLP dependent protein
VALQVAPHLHAKIARAVATQHTIEANLQRIYACIARAAEKVDRDPKEITLVAVTKNQPHEAIRLAYEAGVRHFGENRVQEREEKQPHLADLTDATWHFIGHLQSNKAARALELFHRIDSVDSSSLAQRLERFVPQGTRYPVLLEVKIDPTATKFGVSPEQFADVADAIISTERVDLRGLMGIAPVVDQPDQTRPFFRHLREMRDSLVRRYQMPYPTMSMGMSHDFEIAIEEGSTEVRLGTALFGARRYD